MVGQTVHPWTNVWVFSKCTKSVPHMYVKENCLDEAKRMFADTNVVIITRGKRHLGAALGSRDFVQELMTAKVSKWCEEISI